MWQCRVTSLIKSQISKYNHFPYCRLLLRGPVSWSMESIWNGPQTRAPQDGTVPLGYIYYIYYSYSLKDKFQSAFDLSLKVPIERCSFRLYSEIVILCVGCCRSANYHRFWLARELFWIILHLKNRWILKEIRFTQINFLSGHRPRYILL